MSLNERKIQILQAIINDYIETAGLSVPEPSPKNIIWASVQPPFVMK